MICAATARRVNVAFGSSQTITAELCNSVCKQIFEQIFIKPTRNTVSMLQIPQASQAQALLERIESASIVYKKDVNRIIENDVEGIKIINSVLDEWKQIVDDFEKSPIPIQMEDKNSATASQVDQVLGVAQSLLNCFLEIKTPILDPALETVQNEIISKMRPLVNDVSILLGFYIPDKAMGVKREFFLEYVLGHDLTRSKSAILQQKKQIAQIKTKKFSIKEKSSYPLNKINPLTFQGCLFLLTTIAFMYFLGAWLPPEIFEPVTAVSKVFMWLVALTWFPTFFLSPFSNSKNIGTWLLYLVFWVVGVAIWTYGFFKGTLISILLLTPFFLLMRTKPKELERDAQNTLRSKVYRWGWLSMGIVGILVTGEQIWIIGAAIWLVFTIIAQISFRFFRATFDMISAIDPEQEGNAQIRRRMFYFSYVATVIIAIPGVLGRPPSDFVSTLYQDVGVISFGLMAILIGVQAIIPSIGTWGGFVNKDDTSPSDIREMKVYLRHQEGLAGFMQIFFIVFLVSIVGTAILGIVVDDKFSINFSTSALLKPTPNILDLVYSAKAFHYSPEVTAFHAHNLFFIIFLSLFFYSLSVLYYLFMINSALTLPIKDALKSVPILIQNSKFLNLSSNNQSLLDDLKGKLRTAHKLNGNVITELYLTITETEQTLCNITMTEDFPTASELEKKVLDVLGVVFTLRAIDAASVSIFRVSTGKVNQMKLISIQVDRDEFAFLHKKIETMDMSYKMRQLGCSMAHYLLPESQVL